MKVVLASNNAGKIREFSALLAGFHIELIPQSALNVPEIPETGLTFIENALLKARHAARVTKLPALADDSGLAVAALKGEPGIHSARYAGEKAHDDENIQKLLANLANVPPDQRHASFHCVLAFLLHEIDPTPLVCEGVWAGTILHAKQGTNGFGYDPVFYVPSEGKSSAELELEIKNKISHRGKAMQSLMNRLAEKL